jgi:alkanesulfonate monooxygenase SsuD/methylene tetrahydromethanopterin reductase-like flavin-dependent oxidoreductase (luciferase family)/predicted kinase
VDLPRPCLVVLVGPSCAGKSTWAADRFAAGEIVSSDRLRGMVGEADDDLAASDDAFALLDAIVDARLRRGLTAVVDTLGLDEARRRGWVGTAARHGTEAVAVVFETPVAVLRERNRSRAPRPLPLAVLDRQVRAARGIGERLQADGFGRVLRVTTEAPVAGVDHEGPRPKWSTDGLRFGLHLSRFDWEGGTAAIGPRLRRIAAEAEEAGFESLWVMDHLRQIPQVGRPWEDMPECFTTLAQLAAVTTRCRIGALVAGVTLHGIVQLGRAVATLDVLSGGRAVCGLGAAWFAEEHAALGLEFPPLAERYALLEDALELLPLLWGPGGPPFHGRRLIVPDTACYPRPLQERVPILVGGSGERRTLRLVAEHADACNLRGDPGVVGRKLAILKAHCAEAGRDPAEIEVTHLSTALAAPTADAVAELAARLRPGRTPPGRYTANVNAATIGEHIRRFGDLHAAGVRTAIVRLADLGRDDGAIERFAPVITAYSP